MKRLLILAACVVSVAQAQVLVGRNNTGSGTPGSVGFENATQWDNDIFHAPQYMPGYPTAASIWPRVLTLKCEKDGLLVKCPGYNWLPEMGRGEYLMIRPEIVPVPEPVEQTCEPNIYIEQDVVEVLRTEVIEVEVPAPPKKRVLPFPVKSRKKDCK